MSSIISPIRPLLLIAALLLSACGGGGGGGGGGTASASCTPDSNADFYEVASSNCATNVISGVDFSGSFAISDGGGGGGGDGGGGGGGGGGDLLIRISMGLRNVFYAALGIQNAQAITSCGNGVTSSDLSKLTSTGWKYQPLVKPGTPDGTVCVKRVIDANKYLGVIASGLTQNGQSCRFLLINKTSGSIRCYSSSNPTLDLFDGSSYLISGPDPMKSGGWDMQSVNLSRNKKYLGLMLGDYADQFYIRITVDSDSTVEFSKIFADSTISESSYRPQNSVLLNDGNLIVHYADGNQDSRATGVTYKAGTSNSTSPLRINNNLYTNPQFMIQNPVDDSSFLTRWWPLGDSSTGYLVRYDANGFTTLHNSFGAIDPVAASDGKIYFITSVFVGLTGNYGYTVKYYDLGQSVQQEQNTLHSAFVKNGSTQTLTCNGTAVGVLDWGWDQHLFLSNDESKLILAYRSTVTMNNTDINNSKISAGGLSGVSTFSTNGYSEITSGIERLSTTDCKVVRKFEKGTSGNFAYLSEGYGQGNSTSVSRDYIVLDASMVRSFIEPVQNSMIKLGSVLYPL